MKSMDLANKAEGEEVQNPATSIPRSMILAVIINGMLAFGWIIALLFSIGDVEAALESPTGYPIIEIFYQATGSIGAATAMMCAIITVALFAVFGILASTSRLTWAFARDKGLPYSDFFSYVRETLELYKALLAKSSAVERSTPITRSQSEPLSLWASSSV